MCALHHAIDLVECLFGCAGSRVREMSYGGIFRRMANEVLTRTYSHWRIGVPFAVRVLDPTSCPSLPHRTDWHLPRPTRNIEHGRCAMPESRRAAHASVLSVRNLWKCRARARSVMQVVRLGGTDHARSTLERAASSLTPRSSTDWLSSGTGIDKTRAGSAGLADSRAHDWRDHIGRLAARLQRAPVRL